MEKYSREKIKQRMLKRVAMLWDIEDIEHVDPVVKLLMEGMAEEIFMILGEIGQTDDRLLSKLSVSLTPVTHLTARPSHAIMSARPTESTQIIDKNTLFFTNESQLLRKYNLKTIGFSPIVSFTLTKATVKFIHSAGQFYKCEPMHRKTAFSYADSTDEYLNNNIWIGIAIDEQIQMLDTLSFYIDFINIEDKYQYLPLLQYTQWSLSGTTINSQQGIPEKQGRQDSRYIPSDIVTLLSDLKALYDTHYVTIHNLDTTTKELFPKALQNYYSSEIIDGFTEPLLWLKVSFPYAFPTEVLESLRIGINLFPVANLYQKSISQEMIGIMTYLPLEVDSNEFFVQVESVTDSSGITYHPFSTDSYLSERKTKGIYTLRQGGVEKIGNLNDARSTVARLVDAVRDRILFSNSKAEVTFNTAVTEIFTAVNQISNLLETLGGRTDDKSYLLIDRSNHGEKLVAHYWVTNGAYINNFKLDGATLSVNLELGTLEQHVYFLTKLHSGINPPSVAQIRDIHKYMLTSHDRIITRPDILNFCMSFYGTYIKNIDVKQGSAISKEPGKGVIKTIDVIVTVNLPKEFSLENFVNELLCKLQQRSPDSFNYRIKATQE